MSKPKKANDRLDELDGFALDIPPDEKLPDEEDAYPLAALVNNRDIEEAWQRLRDAKFKLRYEYAKSPEVQERAKAALEEKTRKYLANLLLDFVPGLKVITRQDRPSRAKDYFGQYLIFRHGIKEATAILRGYEGKGFTGTEAAELQKGFAEWWPQHRRKKGKQGRRRSEYDQRIAVRDEEGVTWLSAPPKPLIFTAKEKAKIHKAAVKHGWEEKLPGNFAWKPPIKHKDQSGWGEHHKGKKPKKPYRPEGYRPTYRQPLKAGGLG